MTVPTSRRIVYRVDGPPGRGLWYNPEGEFVGEIHGDLSFCHASVLQMPYDESLVGWRSCTGSPEELLQWISLEEFARLEGAGFLPSVYEAHVTKSYIHLDRKTGAQIPHLVFEQKTARLVGLLTLNEFTLLLPEMVS